MRPHARARGNRRCSASRPPCVSFNEAARTRARKRAAAWDRAPQTTASMRPHARARGNAQAQTAQALLRTASMRPHARARGNLTSSNMTKPRTHCFNEAARTRARKLSLVDTFLFPATWASMRPHARARGNLDPSMPVNGKAYVASMRPHARARGNARWPRSLGSPIQLQ